MHSAFLFQNPTSTARHEEKGKDEGIGRDLYKLLKSAFAALMFLLTASVASEDAWTAGGALDEFTVGVMFFGVESSCESWMI